jgi:hypothetical protein
MSPVAQQRSREQTLGDVYPELAVGLELLFVEELIEGRLVWKIGMHV